MYIDDIKVKLSSSKAKRQHAAFLKATQGMADDQRNHIVDTYVMDFIHHLFHNIQDHAIAHNADSQHVQKLQGEVQEKTKGLEVYKREIALILDKLITQLGKHQISNPSQIPHIFHILEMHPNTQKIVGEVIAHKIDVNDAVEALIREVGNEPFHERHDLSHGGQEFTKASASAYGVYLGYTIPIYPTAYTASSLSRFRPSPPFLNDTYKTPDENFINLLVENKKYDKDLMRRVIPEDNSHVKLAEKAGIPHYLIPPETSIDDYVQSQKEQPIQKSYMAEAIKQKLRGKLF